MGGRDGVDLSIEPELAQEVGDALTPVAFRFRFENKNPKVGKLPQGCSLEWL
jgi:hypothetical protein